MLPKKNRLTYMGFRKNPAREIKINFYYLTFSIKEGSGCPRFTINIPKRVEKLSSKRHRIRRIIVETIRKKLPFMIKKADVLIRVKKPAKEINGLNIRKEVGDFIININR